MIFQDRLQAGKLLAEKLAGYRGREESLVLGVPRGGVVVAKVVAESLKLPLDFVIVRKLGFPGNPELALGAVDLDGLVTLNENLTPEGLNAAWLEREVTQQLEEARRRETLYRGGRKPPRLSRQRVILVDDGIATGQTTLAAIAYLRKKGVREIIVAAPVIAPDTLKRLSSQAERVVALSLPADFAAVGQFYRDFPQVEDEEVVKALEQ